jgi:hypothetical protein
MTTKNLDFVLIDDILDLEAAEHLSIASDSKLTSLGPFVEFAYYGYPDRDTYLAPWRDSEIGRNLLAAINASDFDSARNPISGIEKLIEFIPTPRAMEQVAHPKWETFLIRSQNAAESAGIPKHLAQGLIGTLQEMVDNILWHSSAEMSGIAGYRCSPNNFEYVVADAGIGVFASLTANKKWSTVQDPLEALVKALENGVTRCSDEESRGTGFNRLLSSIAKNSCDLRFHSDSACVKYDGIAAQRTGNLKQIAFSAPKIKGS